MGERGDRRADRACEYLKGGGTERIRRLREQARQMNEYLRARKARQWRASCERSLELSQSCE